MSAAAMVVVQSATAQAGATPRASTPVMVILDASGSMNTADAPGPRITAAKQAVTRLVGALPASAQVGLEVYGTSTSSSAAAKSAGCHDIRVAVPVGPLNKATFTSTVRAVRARGYTPIGAALRKAANALPAKGPRAIVLVSDGIDTCSPPDPCVVARQLKNTGVDLTVDTIGFRVNGAARRQLGCIAAATGGSYHDAGDGAALRRVLGEGVQRAMQPYSVVGTPISGTVGPRGAPTLSPGQYVDTFEPAARGAGGGGGPAKYYSIDLHRGETPYVSATFVPPAGRTNSSTFGVSARLEAPDGTECASNVKVGAGGAEVTAMTVLLDPGAIGPHWGFGCADNGRFILHLATLNAADLSTPLKVELAVRIDAPASAAGLPGPAQKAGFPRVGATGRIRPVSAGDSFNDAPTLAPGRYRDTMVSGETRYYRVHLDWGQRLAFRVAPQRGSHVSGGIQSCYAQVYSPVRENVQLVGRGTSYDSYEFSEFCGQDNSRSRPDTLQAATWVPLRYTNRSSDDPIVKSYSIDGDYYLAVNLGYEPSGDTPMTVPYTLTIAVVGKRERGPAYHPVPPATQSPSGSPTSTSPVSPASGSEASRTSATSSPLSPAVSSHPPLAFRNAAGSAADSTGLIFGSVAGAVVLLAIGVGLLLRRSPPRR